MFSRDDGGTWQSLRLNMPTVAIADLVIAGNDLVVATLGRSAWILDDLTPVQAPGVMGALGPYHVLDLLRQGGMGAVFKAVHWN